MTKFRTLNNFKDKNPTFGSLWGSLFLDWVALDAVNTAGGVTSLGQEGF